MPAAVLFFCKGRLILIQSTEILGFLYIVLRSLELKVTDFPELSFALMCISALSHFKGWDQRNWEPEQLFRSNTSGNGTQGMHSSVIHVKFSPPSQKPKKLIFFSLTVQQYIQLMCPYPWEKRVIRTVFKITHVNHGA